MAVKQAAAIPYRRGTFGLEVLQQQATHPPGADHSHLLRFEADQLILSSRLAELQLRQFNGCGADGDSTRAQVGFRADTFAGADRLGEKPVENRADRLVLLTQAHHLLDLGKDLTLSENKTIETSGHLHQVIDGFVVMKREKMGRKIVGCQA